MNIKIKLLLLSFLVCLIGIRSFAQTGNVKGVVKTSDGKPAEFVVIQIKGVKSTIVNSKGEYFLSNLKEGYYTLETNYIGLTPQTESISIESNLTKNVNFTLAESGQTLKEVIVKGEKNKYKEDHVSTSLRLETPLLEIPQNIQVITSNTLKDQQVISMRDGVLKNVSGVTMVEHWGNLFARVNMRGSRASAFRNGMNVTSSWGPLTEDMSFVEQIEFVKGPAGFLMSNGEPSGIYNVVTKKPTGQTKGEASFTLGSNNLYRTALDLDGKLDKIGKLLYRFNIMGQTANSFRPHEFNDRYSIAPVISYQINDRTKLTAEYTYQHARMSNVGSFYVFAKDGYAKLPYDFTLMEPGLEPTIIKDHSLFANLQHKINNNWKLTAQLAYFKYGQNGSSLWLDTVSRGVYISPTGNIVRRVGIWDAANESKFGQVFINGDIQTGEIRHKILGGLDLGSKQYIADFSNGHNLDLRTAPFNIFNPKYGNPSGGFPNFDRSKGLHERGRGGANTQSFTGLYFQDELGFLDNKLRLTLAGRYTHVVEISANNYAAKRDKNRFTPRLGLSGNIDKQTTAYALYDQSFIPQNGILREGGQPKPITGNNIEAGIKRDWFNGKLNTTIAAYRILKNNATASDPANVTGESFVINIGQTTTQGIEFDLRGQLTTGLNLIANYSFIDSEITKASPALANTLGRKVSGYAKHNANTWLTYTIKKGSMEGIGVAAGFSYQGDRTTWTWTGASGLIPLPDYFKLDGGIFYEKDKIRLTANVFNVLNNYLYSGSAYADYYYWQAEDKRNYRVSIAYQF